MSPADSNPFATRFIRPDVVSYLFLSQVDATHLVHRLAVRDWWGQVIGPHGTGKTTLLHSLRPLIEGQERAIVWLTQGPGEHRLKVSSSDAAKWTAQTQVIVDGYEQLGNLSRNWLKVTCRRRGAGLLVTAHEDVGLPLLWSTCYDEPLAQRLVDGLLNDEQRQRISAADVSRCYQKHAGNLREMLFALYDLYEERWRRGA